MKKRLLSPSLTFGTFNTVGSNKIFIQSRRGQVYANDAKIIDGDIMALNGAIHVIDTVLFAGQNQSELIIPEQTFLPDKLMPFEPIIHQRSEMRKKRAISKIHGKNCGTRPGPKPRHITSSRNDDDPRLGFEKFRHLTRNTIWMKNKD